ncbi:MAG: hypothetical protein IKK84_04430 [Clostridia bacterium]|nr:hypothetical protein [Clostridia bacterium]
MSRVKKILISAAISLGILLIATYIVNLNQSGNTVEIPFALTNIKEGMKLDKIKYLEVNMSSVDKKIFDNIPSTSDIKNGVANKEVNAGEVLLKNKIISKEEYLSKTQDTEIVSLPIKGATEGVSYKLKKMDKINVYYTAKKKAVDGILKNKIKVYSTNKEETMVTCLLLQNIEVIALTNNMGAETIDGTATNVLVRLKSEDVLMVANLKEQGTFTYSLI